MKNEQQKNRTALLLRMVPQVLLPVDSFAAAAGTVRALGGLHAAFLFSIGALAENAEQNRARTTLLLDAAPPDAYDTFDPMQCFAGIVLYLRHGELLEFRHKHRLEEYFEESLSLCLADAYDLCGGETATAVSLIAFLFLYGERFKNTLALQCARHRLEQLEYQLEGGGHLSEYNSPSRLPYTIAALATLASLSAERETRDRARHCEQALWHCALSFYDREAATILGPYAYAEGWECCGGTTLARILFFCIFGNRMPIRPFENDLISEGERGALLAGGCFLAATEFHCPAVQVRHTLEHPFPCEVSGEAEVAPFAERDLPIPGENANNCLHFQELLSCAPVREYPGGKSLLLGSFREGVAMGCATRPFLGGEQSKGFFALLKAPTVHSQSDICALSTSLHTEKAFSSSQKSDQEGEMGRLCAFQTARTAMLLYAPRYCAEGICGFSLRLSLSNAALVREMRCGIRPLRAGDTLPIGRDPLCLHFGRVFAAVLPMIEEGMLHIRSADRGLVLSWEVGSLSPAEAPPTSPFPLQTEEEQRCFRLGLVLSLRTADECGTFEEFCRQMGEYTLRDTLCASPFAKGAKERRTAFLCGEERLECAVSPLSEGIRFLRANGKRLL